MTSLETTMNYFFAFFMGAVSLWLLAVGLEILNFYINETAPDVAFPYYDDESLGYEAIKKLGLNSQFSKSLSSLLDHKKLQARYFTPIVLDAYGKYRLLVKIMVKFVLISITVYAMANTANALFGKVNINNLDFNIDYMVYTLLGYLIAYVITPFSLYLGQGWLLWMAGGNKSYLARMFDYKPDENFSTVRSSRRPEKVLTMDNYLKISDMDNCLEILKTLDHIALHRHDYKYLPKSIRKRLVQLEIRLYLLAAIAMGLDTDRNSKSVGNIVTIMLNNLVDSVTMQRMQLLEDELKDKDFWLKARKSKDYKHYKRPVKMMLDDINCRLDKSINDTSPLVELAIQEMNTQTEDNELNTYLKRADQINKLK